MVVACWLTVLASFWGVFMPTVTAATELNKEHSYLYLEAERFDDVGGWTVDAQFRQQMGSTYLLAAGTGVPVADAVTRVEVPRSGAYHLWVRCKDWDRTSPGKFQVGVNDVLSATTFGEQKKGWAWISGGRFDLEQGPATVRLHDLTGYYGRCDAVLLTTAADYVPPDDLGGIARMREGILGRQEPESLAFDFVVVGGGYGGICAAVQAARLGLKTALIQNRPCLGGNASREINVGPGGACPHTSRFRETGICEEIAEGFRREGVANWTDAIELVVKHVPGLTVFYNTEGVRAVMEDKKRIVAVETENVVSGKRYLFKAPLFADCTGDGAIAFSAGAEFRHGQEGRDEYDESLAPEKPNPHTMGTSIIHGSVAMDTPQPFTAPAFATRFTAEHFTKRKKNLVSGEWWIEYGGMLDTIKDAEEIRDELLRVIFGAFDWAKNHDPDTRDKVRNYRLKPVPTVGGKRESRRFIGDLVLTQNDVQSAVLFPDRVAFGGWPIDLHPSPGIYGKDVPPAIFTHLETIYSIPYRILYTRDVENLFLAGRHVSVTHVALGSTRLMQTIGLMGQAVGAAAWICWKHGTKPRGVYPAHIDELQQVLLKWDVFIPGVSHRDSGDLCRGARATASSSCADDSLGFFGSTEPKPDRDAPCTMARGQYIGVTKSGVQTISLQLRAEGDEVQEAILSVEESGVSPPVVVKSSVKPGGYRWVDFKLAEPLKPGKEYFVWLAANPRLCWRLCRAGDGRRTYGKPGAWTTVRGSYVIKPYGAAQRLGRLGPEMAVDGMSWPTEGQARQWRSDPAKGLPQWLEIDFGQNVTLNTVYLTFDSNIFGRFPSIKPGAEVTAQDYRLLYNVKGQWKTAFTESDNWRRFRPHRFGDVTTDRVRLEILKALNSEEARVYQIRAYRE